MQYDVQDLTETVAGHSLTIRTMTPVVEEGFEYTKPLRRTLFMSCSECGVMAEYHSDVENDLFNDLDIVQMEMRLHAEGFDTEWQMGELQQLAD